MHLCVICINYIFYFPITKIRGYNQIILKINNTGTITIVVAAAVVDVVVAATAVVDVVVVVAAAAAAAAVGVVVAVQVIVIIVAIIIFIQIIKIPFNQFQQINSSALNRASVCCMYITCVIVIAAVHDFIDFIHINIGHLGNYI